MSRRTIVGLLLVAAVALASPAAASAKIRQFQTPSGNIQCGWFKFGQKPASIRCDISSQENPAKPRPKSCEFDFGYSYAMNAKGKSRRACVSDAVGGPGTKVLAYGTTFAKGGIVCASTEAFLRCANSSGHGFKLSRSAQSLF